MSTVEPTARVRRSRKKKPKPSPACVPCAACKGDTQVLRTDRDKNTVVRRRKCLRCDATMVTRERLSDESYPWHLTHKDGRR